MSQSILSSITYWNHVLRYGREQGIDMGEFDSSRYHCHGDFVAFEDFQHLLVYLDKAIQNPALGLELARKVEMSTHGSLGFAVSHSRNLRECLELIASYYQTRMQALKIETPVEGEVQVLRITPACDWEPVSHIIYDAILLTLTNVIAYAIGDEVGRCELRFPYGAPDDTTRYDELVASQYSFDKSAGEIRIPLELMDIPLISANQRSLQLGKHQCEAELADLQQLEGTGSKVRELILASPDFSATVESTATSLNMSKSTLIRRLKSEDTSFSAILDALRKQQAAELLLNSSLSVEAIAWQLGYEDASNFGRSFKRWFGCSPTQYRQQKSSEQE